MWNLVLAKLGFDGDSVYFQGAYEGRCLHTQCLTLSLPTSRWNINLVSLGKYSIAPLLSFVLFLHPSTSSPSLGLLWRELRPYVQVTHRGNVKRREKAKNFFPPWPDDSWCFADPSSLTTRTPFYKGRTVKFLILLWKSWHDWIPFQLHFSDSLSPCIYRRLESNHRDFQISPSQWSVDQVLLISDIWGLGCLEQKGSATHELSYKFSMDWRSTVVPQLPCPGVS